MSQNQPSPTTQIKLLVNSASEAVSVLRERYGDAARVLSVKQVEVGGLKRLISKPRLEVIVEVPSQEKAVPATKPQKASTPAPSQHAAPKAETPKPAEAKEQRPEQVGQGDERSHEDAPQPKGKALGNLYAKRNVPEKPASSGYFSDFEDSAPPATEEPQASAASPAEAPLGSAANPVKRGTLDAVKRATSMLESVGFDRTLIERMRSEIDFKDVGSQSAMDLYAKICDWLRSRFPNTKNDAVGTRRAFFGCSGVGKTAALSKMLSGDVFARGLTPTVLKVDSDLPNPSDALEVFCEIMGATLARSLEEVETVSEESPLLIDMPGFSLSSQDSINTCRDTLDELEVDERILVVNAAYEAELIAEMMSAGEMVGATRVVFTHLEETRKVGKLWKFLLNGRIKPLFFCVGPNPAGEYTMEPFSYLLERSFPNGRQLASAGRRGRSEADRSEAREAPVSR
ncbi:hypothetical protein [Pelagicoccus sp. SDUM812003]|uniref:hypothetical protein n=1 Tax=Pelagicoccus sp. SDUM812003 TaxID=3041267 RepID=UPI00280C52F6|nr:hypothetical protein [Pelagicoccus sp. SDUM812003]MDQ8202548.1 hypothetical protein [Pelagicoccus sp. SDUM812003]